MPRTELTITTPDGECPATLHTPHGEGPWPAVIFFVDAGGTRPVMAEMADHVASLGYAVLLPDVYYRHPLGALLHGDRVLRRAGAGPARQSHG